jgi:hypothetical protein
MTPADRQRLKDAFQKAIDRDPAGADMPFRLQGLEGDFTSRQIIANTLASEKFYEDISGNIAAGVKTLEQYVEEFSSLKMPLVRNKGPQR